MLRIWRGRTIFAECTACGSFGSAPHTQTKLRLAPEIEEARDRHTGHMIALRANFEGAAKKIAAEVEAGSASRSDGAARIKELWANHVAQIQLRVAALPSAAGKVSELVVACPWCGVAEEVELEELAPGQEPAFSLVPVPTPIEQE